MNSLASSSVSKSTVETFVSVSVTLNMRLGVLVGVGVKQLVDDFLTSEINPLCLRCKLNESVLCYIGDMILIEVNTNLIGVV